ncbi:MAG: APC family permease [Candidatus Comchoanobacterales bacterium]
MITFQHLYNSMSQFKHIYGRITLLFASISCMMGSGWLMSAHFAYKIAGNGAILSWLIGSIIVIIIAFCFSSIATRIPIAGGIGRYLAITHGIEPSRIIAWFAWLSCVAVAPTEVRTIIEYISTIYPSVELISNNTLNPMGLSLSLCLMALMTYINMKGIALLIKFNNYIAIWKIFIPIIIALSIASFGFNTSSLNHELLSPDSSLGWHGILNAVSTVVIFSFLGFREVTSLAGETQNPRKAIPFAIIGSVLFCMIAYIIFQIVYIGCIDTINITGITGNGPWAYLAIQLGLLWVQILLYLDMAISPGGAGLMYTATTGRLTYAMSTIQALPKPLSALNHHGVPHKALLFNFIIGCLLLPFSWQELVKFQSIILIFAYLAGPIALNAITTSKEKADKVILTTTTILCNYIILWGGWTTYGIILLCGSVLVAKQAYTNINNLLKNNWLIMHMILLGLVIYISPFEGGYVILDHVTTHIIVAILSVILLFHSRNKRRSSDKIAHELSKIQDKE